MKKHQTVQITRLRGNLRDYVEAAAGGSRLIIEVGGRPVAALVGLDDLQRLDGASNSDERTAIALAAAAWPQLAGHLRRSWATDQDALVVVDGRVVSLPAPRVSERSFGRSPVLPLLAAERSFPKYGARAPGKYTPLESFLAAQDGPEIQMSFDQIEQLIQDSLPDGARKKTWWLGQRTRSHRHAQRTAWIDAGFEVAEVDTYTGVVLFRRC